MNLYLDSADVDAIRDFAAKGVIDGVTTNPSIVATGDRSYRAVVEAIDAAIDGPIFAQVLADDTDGMVEEARAYQSWADHVVAKIPATDAGFEALHQLRATGTPAGITIVFSVEQAVLAAKADATFVAPYVGRMTDAGTDAGTDGIATVERIQEIYDDYGFDTELLAASIRSPEQATACYAAGVDAITMSPNVLADHIANPETDASLDGFLEAWGDRGSPIE